MELLFGRGLLVSLHVMVICIWFNLGGRDMVSRIAVHTIDYACISISLLCVSL